MAGQKRGVLYRYQWLKITGEFVQYAPHLTPCLQRPNNATRPMFLVKYNPRVMMRLSRFALQIKLGRELATEELARHICDNFLCYNEEHLIVGTASENSQDMLERGTHGKLSHEIVRLKQRIENITIMAEIGRDLLIEKIQNSPVEVRQKLFELYYKKALEEDWMMDVMCQEYPLHASFFRWQKQLKERLNA